MPLLTTAQCDCGCKGRIELGGPQDGEIAKAEEILQVTDANSKHFIFLTADCLRRWAAKYSCPYSRPEAAEFIPVDAILPGGTN